MKAWDIALQTELFFFFFSPNLSRSDTAITELTEFTELVEKKGKLHDPSHQIIYIFVVYHFCHYTYAACIHNFPPKGFLV